MPVLSEQITVAHPRVSTDGNFRMSTCLFTMRCTPKARVMDTMAGSPSGMAATARLTDVRNASKRGPFLHNSKRKTTVTIPKHK